MSVCVRSVRRTCADFAAPLPIAGAVPRVHKRAPMRRVQSRDALPDERQLARVEPRKIIVVAKIAVVVPPIPVPRRADAVYQRAILEHRQIERSAIPRDELWRVAFDAVEKAPDQLRFRIARFTKRPYGKC